MNTPHNVEARLARRRAARGSSTRFDELQPARDSGLGFALVLCVAALVFAALMVSAVRFLVEGAALSPAALEISPAPAIGAINQVGFAHVQPPRAGNSFDIRRLGVPLLLPVPVETNRATARQFVTVSEVKSLSLVRFAKARRVVLSLSSVTGVRGQSLPLVLEPPMTAGQSSSTHPLTFRARLGRPLDNANSHTSRKGSGIQYA